MTRTRQPLAPSRPEPTMYRWQSCEWAGPMLAGHEDREIEASLGARAPVPDDVFCYRLVSLWRERIWRMLGDLITDDVRAGPASPTSILRTTSAGFHSAPERVGALVGEFQRPPIGSRAAIAIAGFGGDTTKTRSIHRL